MDVHTSREPSTALTRIAGVVCLCLGLAVLAIAHPALRIDNQIWQPASPLVALELLVGGTGLLAAARFRVGLSVGSGALLGGFSALILLLHGLAPSLPDGARGAWTARLLSVSFPAALSFSLGGLALLLSTRPVRRAWHPAAVAALGSAMLALALVSLLLQVIDRGGNMVTGSPARLPPLLAGGLLAFGFGLMSHASTLSPFNRASRAAWLPISIGLGLATLSFAVWHALAAFDRIHLDHVRSTTAIAFRTHVMRQIHAEADALQRMANRWELSGGTPREWWEADAAAFIADRPGILGMLWLAPPALEPRWGIPYAADAAWTHNLTADRGVQQTLARARDEHNTMLSPGFAIDRGVRGFLIVVPLFVHNRFDGLLAGVIDFRAFLHSLFTDSVLQGFDVIVSDGRGAIYGPQSGDDLVQFAASVRIELSGMNWQLHVIPQPGNAAAKRSALPETTLIVGLLMSALVTLAVHLGQTAALRARELEVANAELERRVQARTAEVQRALVDLSRSNQDLEQFAYIASHDLQEPLRMISSYVQLLGRRYRGRLDADADDFIRFAEEGAERMKRLINDLLAYSRLGAKDRLFHRVDCNRLAEIVRENLALAIAESAADLRVDPLPTVFGDELQVLQVFQNLVGNAIKFHGQDPPQIRIAAGRDGPMVHFTVQDNGSGIDPQYAERIFEIFRRLHAKEAYPGTGLGLAVCKKIVERHGGLIWMTSTPGGGSTFHFTLPAEEGIVS